MTRLLEETSIDAATGPAAQRLRATMAAVRLAFTWFGVRKSLSPQQKVEAADPFGAEGTYLSAAKKLLDTKHPSFKAVTAMRGQAQQLWRAMTLPYPEPGVRLIRQDNIALFNVHLTTLQHDLTEAVAELNDHFGELKSAARSRLGRLFNASDYPATLDGLFSMSWEFPSVEPPDYLRQLSPQLYQAEARRVAARFDEAVRLTEEAFLAELQQIVEHLSERLSGADDGRPKVFRDSAVENLHEFFERFRHLNVRSSAELEQLVDRAQQTVRGLQPQQLRDSPALRQQVVGQLAGVQAVLDGQLVERPRRSILRRRQEQVA